MLILEGKTEHSIVGLDELGGEPGGVSASDYKEVEAYQGSEGSHQLKSSMGETSPTRNTTRCVRQRSDLKIRHVFLGYLHLPHPRTRLAFMWSTTCVLRISGSLHVVAASEQLLVLLFPNGESILSVARP